MFLLGRGVGEKELSFAESWEQLYSAGDEVRCLG